MSLLLSDVKNLFSDFSIDNLTTFSQNHYVLISGTVLTGIVLKLLRIYFSGGVCHSKVRLDGKTVIITGGNAGIGYETALDLANRGGRIILGCRDVTRGEEAAKKIRRMSGNGNVVFRHLDLSSLDSVRQFALETLAIEKYIHILINNAGVYSCPAWKSKEGYELHFAVNHLGHFLLTNLLLDKIKQSAPARIISVSSVVYKWGKINFDDINFETKDNTSQAYFQSKLANILFTRELSKRIQGSGVTVNALHPGAVNSEIGRNQSKVGYLRLMKYILYPILVLAVKTTKQGAQTSIYCAVSEDISQVSGKYFSDCALQDVVLTENNEDTARRLWEVSEKMVNQKFH